MARRGDVVTPRGVRGWAWRGVQKIGEGGGSVATRRHGWVVVVGGGSVWGYRVGRHASPTHRVRPPPPLRHAPRRSPPLSQRHAHRVDRHRARRHVLRCQRDAPRPPPHAPASRICTTSIAAPSSLACCGHPGGSAILGERDAPSAAWRRARSPTAMEHRLRPPFPPGQMPRAERVRLPTRNQRLTAFVAMTLTRHDTNTPCLSLQHDHPPHQVTA